MKRQPETVIAVDARPLSYGITGNSRYLAEVLTLLEGNKKNFVYYLYSNKPPSPEFDGLLKMKNIRFVEDSLSSLPGLVWLNVILPRLLERDGARLFWGTLQMLPVKKLPVPAVVNYHDLNFVSAPETMSRFNYWQHRLLSSFTLKNADTVFCLSATTRNDIIHYSPGSAEKLVVVYPGVKKPKQMAPLPFKNFLFTAATIEPRKNLGIVIQAFIEIRQATDYPFIYVIAGRPGWKEKQLSADLTSGNLEKYGVYFVDRPDDAVLAGLYRKCSAFVFPSLHEGFGLPLLEAMQEGKICLASDIPVFHEILDPTKDLLVRPDALEAWKNALLQIRRKIPVRKWQPAKWSWENTAAKIEEELEHLTHDI